jgi:hypothetical protein
LPSRENQADHGRTSCRCPIASSCTPLSCTPLSTKMPAAISVTASGAVFGVTRRTLRCVAVPLREPPPAADRAQPHQTWVASPAPPASESEEIT